MMALLEYFLSVLVLTLSVSIDYSCSQQSLGVQCTVPLYSEPLHEVNVTEETETLLLIEGRCYLSCLEEVTPFSGFFNRESSLYTTWPFAEVFSDCISQQRIHECTRGCRYYLLNLTATIDNVNDDDFTYECVLGCRGECNIECGVPHGTPSSSCENPDTIDNWVAMSGCNNVCKRPDCDHGCNSGISTLSASPTLPTRPISHPRLTSLDTRSVQDTPPFRAGVYSVDLTEAMPERYTSRNLPLIGFLFKIVDVNTSNITYIWQHDPRDDLNLASHACRSIEVSFAVVNRFGQSNFSDVFLIQEVYGDSNETPDPPMITSIVDSNDPRMGYFQHVRVTILWQSPMDDTFLDHFVIVLENTNREDNGLCGGRTLLMQNITYNSNVTEYSAVLEAATPTSVPMTGCTYLVTVASASGTANTSDSRVLTTRRFLDFVPNYLNVSCSRSWNTSSNQKIYFRFTVSWTVSPQVVYGEQITNFILTPNLVSQDRLLKETVVNTLPHITIITVVNETQYSIEFGAIDRFFSPQSENDRIYKFELEINWNENLFISDSYLFNCYVNASSPQPTEVENISLEYSEFIGTGEIMIVASWSRPAQVNGILARYSMCVVRTRLSGDDGAHSDCNEAIPASDTTINTTFSVAGNTEVLFLQMRAWNTLVPGNWSSPINILVPSTSTSASVVASSLPIEEVLGIVFGAIFAVGVLILCMLILMFVCVCLRRIRKRKKLWRATQTTSNYDPMCGVSFGPHAPPIKPIETEADAAFFDDWELQPSDIVVEDSLGEGAFGEVYKGILKGPLTCSKIKPVYRNAVHVSVAIKLLKDTAKGSERHDFLSEMEMMKRISEGHCSHVVSMLGCVTIREPLCLVTELVEYGDLLSYLRSSRRMYVKGNSGEDEVDDDPYLQLGKMCPVDLISFAYQIAAGMSYLSGIDIVHRDLACRNILVDEGKVLKITDFGMSRETDEIYVQKSKGRVPFKWMAIESIIAQEFTSASDVWSYGITLWEIATLGGVPYPGVPNEELLPLLKRGHRMEKPDNCSSEMYNIMLSCWEEEMPKRPSFNTLRNKIDGMLSAQGKNLYLDFCINPDKPCYTAEAEFLRPFPAANKRRSCHSMLGSNTSVNRNSVDSLLRESPTQSCRSSYRQKSCSPSPTLEKPHATNSAVYHFTEKKNNMPRPNSMMLQNRDSEKGDEDRYVKDPSFLTSPMFSLPNNNNLLSGGERRGGGSDGSINLNSGPVNQIQSVITPEITITKT